jgi:hypothetical protein
MEKWFGRPIYRYKVIKDGEVIYSTASVSDDQDSIVKQLEASIAMRVGMCRLYRNGELIGKYGGYNASQGKVKSFHRRIQDKETGQIYKSLRDMVEVTGWEYKYCNYLVTRTMRYVYLD